MSWSLGNQFSFCVISIFCQSQFTALMNALKDQLEVGLSEQLIVSFGTIAWAAADMVRPLVINVFGECGLKIENVSLSSAHEHVPTHILNSMKESTRIP